MITTTTTTIIIIITIIIKITTTIIIIVIMIIIMIIIYIYVYIYIILSSSRFRTTTEVPHSFCFRSPCQVIRDDCACPQRLGSFCSCRGAMAATTTTARRKRACWRPNAFSRRGPVDTSGFMCVDWFSLNILMFFEENCWSFSQPCFEPILRKRIWSSSSTTLRHKPYELKNDTIQIGENEFWGGRMSWVDFFFGLSLQASTGNL